MMIFFLLLFSFFYIQSFEVKVLLKKVAITDLIEHPVVIHSKTGFILSQNGSFQSAYHQPSKTITCSSMLSKLLINGRQYLESNLYLYPQMSLDQAKKIESCFTAWFDMLHFDLVDKVDNASMLLKLLQDQKYLFSMVDQERLKDAVTKLFVESFEQNRTSKEAFPFSKEKLYTFLYPLCAQFCTLFVEELNKNPISLKNFKKINVKNTEYYDYFQPIIYNVCKKILHAIIKNFSVHYLADWFDNIPPMFEIDGVAYQGSCIVYQEKGYVYFINNILIDDYLYSVVRYEGFPGWPYEMNRLLAIICRSYLIHQVLQAKKINRPYHIQNGIKHQRYHGHHNHVHIKEALRSTKDIVIGYQARPAIAMYDSCCGGVIPAHIDDPELKKIPYLARVYPCEFCKSYKVATWNYYISEAEILERLKKEFVRLTKIIDIFVSKKDKAGLIKQVTIVGQNKRYIISEKKLKSFIPEMKSYCCFIHKESGKFHFSGKGFGHHKGLCQWGAMHLIKHEEWSVEEVLNFYYPGTNLIKLVY